MKKVLALVIVSMLFVSAFSGCGPSKKASSKGDDENKQVTLKWVMPGPGKQQDSEMVWEEFNEKLKSYLPNTKVEIECYPVSNYADKWKLMAASSEKIDIAWTGYLLPVVEEQRRGAYLALNDLLDKFGQDAKAEIPDTLFKMATIDNKIYCMPSYQMMPEVFWGLRIPKKLVTKYNIDTKKIADVFQKYDTITPECFDVLEPYLKAIKDGGDIGMGVGIGSFDFLGGKGFENIVSPYVISRYDDQRKVMLNSAVPQRILLYQKYAEWFKKGYIRQDALSVQNLRQDEGKENGYIMWVHNYDKSTALSESKRYGFDIEVIPLAKKPYIPSGVANGNAIARTSENPERAMKLLNLLYSNKGKELYNLLYLGIEGTHYKPVSENRVESLTFNGQSSSSSKYGLWKWVLGNTFLAKEIQSDMPSYNDYIKNEFNPSADISPLIGFVPNTDKIKTQLAQVRAVQKEFSQVLLTGAVDNYEVKYKEMLDKVKLAGSDEIVNELQKQLDEWAKTNINK